jgi:hypothetical protein
MGIEENEQFCAVSELQARREAPELRAIFR